MKKLVIFVVVAMLILGGVWYVENYTNFFAEAKIVPPTPVFADCTRVQTEIEKYDWDTELALAVAKAESSCNAEARGDEDITFYACPDGAESCAEPRLYGYSVGVFQVRILPGRESCDSYDIATNVACAYDIYIADGRSFEPWSGWTTGKYKNYLWRAVEDL